jgi:nitrate reductase delta subunit
MASHETGYALLGELLEYPDEKYKSRADRCFQLLAERQDDLASMILPFQETVRTQSLEQLQELFTRTFDINPVCTLEVGWHIYGEDYARGEFLVKMREKLREHNIPESCELPDHLSHVLTLLWRLGSEEADELAARYVLPALAKMLKGFTDPAHPFKVLLEAIVSGVKSHHNVEVVQPRKRRGDPPGWANRLPMLGPEVKSSRDGHGGGNNGVR